MPKRSAQSDALSLRDHVASASEHDEVRRRVRRSLLILQGIAGCIEEFCVRMVPTNRQIIAPHSICWAPDPLDRNHILPGAGEYANDEGRKMGAAAQHIGDADFSGVICAQRGIGNGSVGIPDIGVVDNAEVVGS